MRSGHKQRLRFIVRVLPFAAVLLFGFAPAARAEGDEGARPSRAGDEGAESPARKEPTLEDARTAFLKGRELIAEEKWREAGDEFAYAARAKNTPGLRYYVGYCREQEGLLIEALGHYRSAERLLAEAPAADVETLIPEAIKRVLGALPQLTFRGLPEGVSLHVDEKPMELKERIVLDPGPHKITLRAPGYVDYERDVILSRASTEVLDVEMTPETLPVEKSAESKASPPAQESKSGAGPSLKPVVFWTSVGVGILGAGVTVVGGVGLGKASSQKRESQATLDQTSGASESACYEPSGDLVVTCEDLSTAAERQGTFRALLIGGGAATALGVSAALVTHFFWPEGAVKVGSLPVPRGAVLSLGAAF